MTLLRIVLAPLLILFTGCGEPLADLSKPNSHRAGSLSFDYPANWKIDQDLVTPDMQFVTVESPGDAIAILQSYSANEADDLSALAKAFSKDATEEMPFGKTEPSSFKDMPGLDGYEWILEEFEISFLGESVPHRRLYGSKELGEKRVVVIFQVATEDYKKAEPGFNLISKSLHAVPEAEEVNGE